MNFARRCFPKAKYDVHDLPRSLAEYNFSHRQSFLLQILQYRQRNASFLAYAKMLTLGDLRVNAVAQNYDRVTLPRRKQ